MFVNLAKGAYNCGDPKPVPIPSSNKRINVATEFAGSGRDYATQHKVL